MLNDAWPLPSTATFAASTVLPSANVTLPTGTPLPDVTVAVKVTDCPTSDGLGDEVTVVAVAKFCTTWTTLPLLDAKIESDAYVAVIVLLPCARVDVLKEATPLLLRGTWAKTLLPCWKVTCPVGVPVPGGTAATVAVNVTDCPLFDGLGVDASAVDEALA